VTPQDPVTINRGLKVFAGGKRMLEMSYAHLNTLAQETDSYTFGEIGFSFDSDGNGWYSTDLQELGRISPVYDLSIWDTATINNQSQTVQFLGKSLFSRSGAVYVICSYSGNLYLVDAATRNQIGPQIPSLTTINQIFFIDGRVWINAPQDNKFLYSNAWPPTSWISVTGQGFLFPHNGRAHFLTNSKLYRIEGTTLIDIGDYKYDSYTAGLDSIFRKGSITKLKAKEGTTQGVLTLEGDAVSFDPTTATVYSSIAYVAGAHYGFTANTVKRATDLIVSSGDPTVLTFDDPTSLFAWQTGNAELLVTMTTVTDTLRAYRTVEYKSYLNFACNFLPVGSVISYLGLNDPEGWMICDGRAISRKIYSALFNLIGTTFGAGDGFSTFNIPNFRGAFLRGAGSQAIPNDITYTGPNIGQSQKATRISDQVSWGHHIYEIAETDGFTNQNIDFFQNVNNASLSTPIYRIRPFNFGVNFIIKVF
jgi:microcystin-dependent protein